MSTEPRPAEPRPSGSDDDDDDQPERQPPGTGDVVVRSPALAAPWDYGPESVDLHGAQFTPRWRQAARRTTRNTTRPRYDR